MGRCLRSTNDTFLRRVMHAVFNCKKSHVYFDRLMIYLSMIERNSKHIHLRSVLNRKIKLLSEGVALSPMMYVTKQYAIAICKVGGMRYTANDGCFHRHIQMRQNSGGLLVKKLFDWI